MAIIQLSGLINSISGNIGGTTFFRTSNGQTASNRRFSKPYHSAHLATPRFVFNYLASAWSGFSLALRDQWEQFAVFADKPCGKSGIARMSGRQIFLHCNYNLLATGTPPITVPVFQRLDLADISLTSITVTATLDVLFSRVLDPAIEFPYLQLSAPTVPAKSPYRSPRFLMKTPPAASDTWDVSAWYLTLLGALPAVASSLSVRYGIQSAVTGLWRVISTEKIEVI